jgi:hypothetical protein
MSALCGPPPQSTEHTRCWVSLLRDDTALRGFCRKLGLAVHRGNRAASVARGAVRMAPARTAALRNVGTAADMAGCGELVSLRSVEEVVRQ